MNLFY